jgi:hypothetical protein
MAMAVAATGLTMLGKHTIVVEPLVVSGLVTAI